MSVEFTRTITILRIFSVEKAKEFYIGWLGFKIDWEHQFEQTLPNTSRFREAISPYTSSEHYGDARPGSTVSVDMRGD
jgi:catechol 2,3-dioxygenase-like lactoylglutathione lyase family enzyme